MSLQAIRLLAEYRLIVSAELPRDHLERNLAMLAQAGLHGMVSELLRFEINGQPCLDIEPAERPDPTPLRPPPDPRVGQAARELRKLSRMLDDVLGASRVSPGNRDALP